MLFLCRMQVLVSLLHFKDKHLNVYTAAMNILLCIFLCIVTDHGHLISGNNMQLSVLYCTVPTQNIFCA